MRRLGRGCRRRGGGEARDQPGDRKCVGEGKRVDLAGSRNIPNGTWTLWQYDFTPPGAGEYELWSRVTTDDGRATDPDYALDYGGYTGYGTLRVTVSG